MFLKRQDAKLVKKKFDMFIHYILLQIIWWLRNLAGIPIKYMKILFYLDKFYIVL